MKRSIIYIALLFSIPCLAQTGYEIKVTFKPFKNQYIYLGHYFGKQYPIIDSVKLDGNSQAIFKGDKKLPGGIYLVGYPNKAGFFEMLIDKQQHFSVLVDTATINKDIVFKNSTDNSLFRQYQQHMSSNGQQINAAKQQLAAAKNATDSAKWAKELTQRDQLIRSYRDSLVKANPKHILSALLQAMREPQLPPDLLKPVTRQDSLDAYYFTRNHYWDGVNFWDGRLAYTTFFEEKLDKYINELMVPHPDSVIREMDHMLGFASISPEMTKMMLLKFVNRFLTQKYMWEDAVFVHLFEKYFSQKEYPWLTPAGRKLITDRAYNLMSNIMGTAASDISLPDSTGTMRSLYSHNSSYSLVVFWDPTCGHCREVLPKLDSLYRAKWKDSGLAIYAVARETDGTKKDWLKFISDHQIPDWTHVYYSKADEKSRTDSGVPGYSQLYDVQTFPTLYLLDKEKRIIAKKLGWEQMDEILQLKIKGQ